PLPVEKGTLFQIGSITKTFTGTVIMQLIEAGKLTLDGKVVEYLPDFRVADETTSQNVTIRHLLTHLGGWDGDLFLETGDGADALPKYVEAMAEREQLAPLGSVYSYNNAGFTVLGAMSEAVTGQSYEAVMSERLLEPLGLENTFFRAKDVMTRSFASGHQAGREPVPATPWALARSAFPAGGLICDVRDLLTYAQFHIQGGVAPDGTRLLGADAINRMREIEYTFTPNRHTGLAWMLGKYGDTMALQHGGGTVGQISLLTVIPEQRFALATFTNSGMGGRVNEDVLGRATKLYFDIEIPKPEPVECTTRDLEEFVGRYERTHGDLELGILNGRLVAQQVSNVRFPTEDSPAPPAIPPVSLTVGPNDSLYVQDGQARGFLWDVVRKSDGSVGWLRIGGRILRKL
ncbi:MAG: serine hydrolase, partial [Gammaproteobacteria bacterium]